MLFKNVNYTLKEKFKMSKIAEKRTDEIVGEYHDGDYTDHSRHNTQWVAFKQGYEQAMQDFMEKAEKYLRYRVYYNMHPSNVTIAIQEFKNYMQNEM